MSLESNLRSMEQSRERYWLRYPGTSPVKLRWRALTVRHSLHVLPGERILEFGAGTGLWTEHLTGVFRGQNPITAAGFNDDLAASAKPLRNVSYIRVEVRSRDLPAGRFDSVVGPGTLCTQQSPASP